MEPRFYTVTEIADELCRADGVNLSDNPTAHSQVRNAVRRHLLQGGKLVDKRGTLAFPELEIYRARVFNTLSDWSMDLSRIEGSIVPALDRAPEHKFPDRCSTEGTTHWQGFRDVVAGVLAGEEWSLVVTLQRPGALPGGQRLTAQMKWAGDVEGDNEALDADFQQFLNDAFGEKIAVLAISLNELFKGILRRDI